MLPFMQSVEVMMPSEESCDDMKLGPLANGLLQIAISNSDGGPGICGGCSEMVCDKFYLLAADRCWHVDCLRCSVCSAKLEFEAKCYFKDGHIYCKEDYFRQFVRRCDRCLHPISRHELVMRLKKFVYHERCFTCVVCHAPFHPNSSCAINCATADVFCPTHYESLLRANTPELQSEETYSVLPRRSKKRRSAFADDGYGRLALECGDFSPMSVSQRNKRMRTSFKHHQLKAMKAYFALNHNPDAKDLKQLAQRTGLTKRVLQVWFQNARAKYRRSLQQDQGAPTDIPEEKAIEPKLSPETNEDSDTAEDSQRMIPIGDGNLFGPLEPDMLMTEQQEGQNNPLFFYDSVA